MTAKLQWTCIIMIFGGVVVTNLVSRPAGAVIVFAGLVTLTVMIVRQWRLIAPNLAAPHRREMQRWWLLGMSGTILLGSGFIIMLDTPWLYPGMAMTLCGLIVFLVFLVHEYRANERDYAQVRKYFAEAELAQEEEAHRAAGDAAE